MHRVIADRYQILDILGAGGMGTVYKARDIETKQIVAIKHLKPDVTTPDMIERFKGEGEALRDLNHPNIVKMLDAVEDDQQHYLVIEYLSGGDLSELLKKEPLMIERVLKLGLEIADALTRAHHLNIIHRDLKPANVLIAEDGTPRLSDFGIAHFGAKQRVTATNAIIGTIDYLAPEMLNGEAVDTRADIWSFGVMLFEMLTAKRPFKGLTVAQTMLEIMTEPVADIEELRVDVPVALADLIYRMLEKDPQQRIPSVRYIGAELETILHGNGVAPKTPAQTFRTPTPSSSTPVRHNLPMQLTNFVGRTKELAELSQLLQNDNVRLVTIVAQGGMGKSRLALEVARQNLQVFADGVYFIELAPLSEPESIVQALIDATRCPFAPDANRTRTQQLVEFLAEKDMLLVLDNFEHLMAGASIVSAILSATTQVRILATSRQRLNQSNENIVLLEPMPYPDWLTPEDAMNYDAFQLFVQAARRIQSDFELTKANLDNVVRICQGVQGLPLGIILAASWLSMLTPQEIVAEMQQSFDFLESDLTDLPERQRSMRQVFEYSWRLMTEKEQQTLMALSVFRGGFTRESAAEICQAGLRDLMGLVNKSLINRDTVSGRYDVHELLRQYAAEHLQKTGQQEKVHDAHKAYFAQWMKAREGEITYRRQQAALDDIETDFENVRFAWELAVQQKDYANLDQMIEALHLFTEMRIRHDEGHKMLQAALDITPTTERLSYRLIFRIVRLAHYGGFGHYESKLSSVQQGQMQAETHQDNDELGFGLFVEGIVYEGVSVPLFEKALTLLSNDSFYRSHVVERQASSIGTVEYHDKKRLFEEALALHREKDDVNEIAWTLANFINLLGNYFQFSEIERYIEEALHYSRLIRHPHAESWILSNAAYMTLMSGEFEKTLEIAERSYYLARQANQSFGQLNANLLKLQAKYLLNEPVEEIWSEIRTIIHKNRNTFPWFAATLDKSPTGALIHTFKGDDAAARQAWQSNSYLITPALWTISLASEAVAHTRFGLDEFAAVLVGHLATYSDDVVGWLKRWSRYQDSLVQLQSRLDADTYQKASLRGQSLSLDEMVQELKINTGMVQ
jgi:serine/threonine protein kinase